MLKKDRVRTSNVRKIKNNLKRFISLLCMSLLGVGFYAGIQATSPDMINTLDAFLDEQKSYDLRVVSTLGLTDSDVEAIQELDSVETVEGVYSQDILMETDDEEVVIKMIGINENVNVPYLVDGKMPEDETEVVVEEDFLEELGLNIGDTIVNEDTENFSVTEYKIVGTVESPIYFSIDRGTTSLGTGQIDYYVYCENSIFNSDYYSDIYVTVEGAKELTTNEDDYIELIETVENEIESIKQDREDIRYNEIYESYAKQLAEYGVDISSLDVSSLNIATSKWYIYDRSDNSAYSDYIDSTEGVSKIGDVFPTVFYIVAILVSLVSMMRMVEEDRGELGTLKALGYSNFKILTRYISYSLIATLLGGFIGMAIGFNLIPRIIWNIYLMLFTVPNFIAGFNISYGLIGLIIAVVCICGAAIFVALKELKSTPNQLMRPKAPKPGKRVILEKITFLWNRIKFSNKITIRNLFRYKTRVLVTIIGVTGCTALMLAGFGLKDAISVIADYQFENVLIYDKLVTLKSSSENETLKEELEDNNKVKDSVFAKMETVMIYGEDEEYSINLTVAENDDELEKVISLNDANNDYEKVILEDNKVVINTKMADLLSVEVGDKVIFKDDSDNEHKIEVMAIVENYVYNYAYMTKSTYESIFGEFESNVILININDLTDEENDELDKFLLSNTTVASVVSSSTTVSTVTDMMDSLNSVVLILIVASAMLAFVVMYNLSNINISERHREIATLKVLGFYDKEVDDYITKETIILTIIGIAIGLFLGKYLCYFIITSCETNTLEFVREIKLLSYILSAVITAIFTLIVNFTTHRNLKKIDMIESLKNVE